MASSSEEVLYAMSENLTFGQWLRQQRAGQRLNRPTLGKLVGCSPETIKAIENGRLRPGFDLADRLVSQLDVPEEQREAFVRWARGADEPTALPVNGNGSNADDPVDTAEHHPVGEPPVADVACKQLLLNRSRMDRWHVAAFAAIVLLAGAVAAITVRDAYSSGSKGPIRIVLVHARRVIPGGLWISPPNGHTFARSVHFAAQAYPTNPGDPPIRLVIFTAWWPGVGAGPWVKVCKVSKPVDGDVYRCVWRIHGAPPGPIRISFDVYDRAGNYNLAPNGVHVIYYRPAKHTHHSSTAHG